MRYRDTCFFASHPSRKHINPMTAAYAPQAGCGRIASSSPSSLAPGYGVDLRLLMMRKIG